MESVSMVKLQILTIPKFSVSIIEKNNIISLAMNCNIYPCPKWSYKNFFYAYFVTDPNYAQFTLTPLANKEKHQICLIPRLTTSK